MLNRREFIEGTTATLLLFPVASAIKGCGYGSSNPPPTCNGVLSTSSISGGHSHTLCVLASDLTNPPAEGKTYNTDPSGGHTHQVSLTQAQLQAINGGQSVQVTTSAVNAHTHLFTIVKMASTGGTTSSGGGGYRY